LPQDEHRATPARERPRSAKVYTPILEFRMKKVRMAMLVATMVLGTGTVVRAQDPQQQGGRPNQIAMLMNGITLTADQQTKIDAIAKKYQEQLQALRTEAQNGGDRQAVNGKRRELMTKQSDEVKAVLTDEQKKVFDKNYEEMRSRMQNRGSAPSTPPTH
jgi:Spy/CpxP family protein refolding chaperone